MTRSKRFSRLIQKLNNRKGSVFDTNAGLVGMGSFKYENNNGAHHLYLEGIQIPLSSLRNIALNFYNNGALVFIDPKYSLATR